MTKTRRWLSLLMAACLTASLFPVGAVAEENVQEGTSSTFALNLGADVIKVKDKVYFGEYGGDEVSWSVLSTNGNGGSYEDSEDEDYDGSALFLLSDTAWDQTAFGSNNTYSGSTLQTTLLRYASNNFTDLEQTAILETSKKADETTTLNYTTYTNPILDNDTLFALSAAELVEYLGYTNEDSSWTAGLGGSTWWWLRSALSGRTDFAGFVGGYGDLGTRMVDTYGVWARPAFNLNMNSVLFTSAAEGGKSDAASVGALQSVSTGDYSEWKLTLKDENRNFAVESATVSGESTLTVSYSGATIGDDEYISAIVVDEDESITYYGRIKSTASDTNTSDTVEITLPTGFDASTDTLYLFSEQYNGDKNTDYASELQEVALYGVANELTNIETSNSSTFCLATSNYTATFSASDGYSLPNSITVTAGGTTLEAETDYTYDSSTGQLTIYASAITGNIVITVQAVLVDTGNTGTGTGGSGTGGSTASTTGTTSSSTASTSSDTSTSSESSDDVLPQTGDTGTALLLGAVATLGLSALAIACSLAQRRRHRTQGAHVRTR